MKYLFCIVAFLSVFNAFFCSAEDIEHDCSFKTDEEYKAMRSKILWSKFPTEESLFSFPSGTISQESGIWERRKLFLLKKINSVPYSMEEDIAIQLALISRSYNESTIQNIDLNKCSMQTLYILFDKYRHKKAGEVLLKRASLIIMVIRVHILSQSARILIDTCLKTKAGENIDSETRKVIEQAHIGYPLYKLPPNLQMYWENTQSEYVIMEEC